MLPLFSKIIEKIINERFQNFFSRYNVIIKQQYGFQKGKTTELALLHIKEKIIRNIENELFTIGLFIDFSKAFDSIKHDILLSKLEAYGIRGTAHKLITNYLTSRMQYTLYNNSKSAPGLIKYGVPQGSILGPLLFLIYINDIPNIQFTEDLILYADDTNIFFSGADISKLETTINKYLTELSSWLLANGLTLNTNKTKYIVFSSINRAQKTNIELRFQNNLIDRVENHKFIGVWFNQHMNWAHHVNKIRNEISKSIGLLSSAKRLLPENLKYQLYYALIYTKVYYCFLVWGNTTKTNLTYLQLQQKKSCSPNK